MVDRPDGRDPVHVRHDHVSDDEVRPKRFRRLDQSFAVAGCSHYTELASQQRLNPGQDILVIVRDEQPWFLAMSRQFGNLMYGRNSDDTALLEDLTGEL